MISGPDGERPDETREFKALSPGTLISHFKIMDKIGVGGMGVVYKAEDTRLRRTVALKFLPPHLLCDADAKARFEHEAQSASALNHPNITTIYEIEEVDGRCFIAMEYIEGRTLKDLIKGRRLSLDEILDISLQIAEGLNAAHKRGVVHRDVKPDNIMVTSEGKVKITDFGLAKLKGSTKLTKTGTTVGTLNYMSPEQARGEELDQRSDIFSFGVVFYEMVTGRLPFKGEYERAIVYSILNDTPEPLARYKADVPEGFQRIVRKALEKDRQERYQHADGLAADLRHEQRLAGDAKTVEMPKVVHSRTRRKPILRFVIPAAVVSAVVLLLFIFEPFRLELGPRKEAAALENSLAVMYFDNVRDPEDQDKIAHMITSLLITDLSESEYIQVVSRQRLYDILRLLGKEDLKVIDRTVASQVAEKAGVRWILTGELLRTEPDITLTSDISDAETGKIIASQRMTAGSDEDLFAVVDRLSAQIKEALSLPAAAQAEKDRAVADVTTHSPEAYRYYMEGLDYEDRYYYPEAAESYVRALEFDSTFAMAYYRLSLVGERETWEKRQEWLAKAVKYSERASWKEKHYIRASAAAAEEDTATFFEEIRKIIERDPEDKEAVTRIGANYYGVGQYAEAVRYLERAIEIDPLYKSAYNMLAYAYHRMENPDKSIWAINKYIDIAPDEPNPYDTRGDLYREEGNLKKAAESYAKANAINRSWWESLTKLGYTYVLMGEYAKADSCFRRITSSDDEDLRSRARICLALVPLRQGKLDEALAVLDDGIAADRLDKRNGWFKMYKHYVKSEIQLHRGDPVSALKEFETFMESHQETYPDEKFYPMDEYPMYLADAGDFERAKQVAEEVEKLIDDDEDWQSYDYWYTLAYMEMAPGNYEEARVLFEKIPEDHRGVYHHCRLGQVYLELGRLDEAVACFEEMLSDYSASRVWCGPLAVKARYLLGICYEKSGWNRRAIEQYETFLDIWKDADQGIPEVEDARRRLAGLTAKT